MESHARGKGEAPAGADRSDPAIRIARLARRLPPAVIATVILLFLLACAPVASAQPAAGPWDPPSFQSCRAQALPVIRSPSRTHRFRPRLWRRRRR